MILILKSRSIRKNFLPAGLLCWRDDQNLLSRRMSNEDSLPFLRKLFSQPLGLGNVLSFKNVSFPSAIFHQTCVRRITIPGKVGSGDDPLPAQKGDGIGQPVVSVNTVHIFFIKDPNDRFGRGLPPPVLSPILCKCQASAEKKRDEKWPERRQLSIRPTGGGGKG